METRQQERGNEFIVVTGAVSALGASLTSLTGWMFVAALVSFTILVLALLASRTYMKRLKILCDHQEGAGSKQVVFCDTEEALQEGSEGGD